MSKLKELTEQEQEVLLQMAVQMGIITEQEKVVDKPTVIIDKYSLQKLFWNTKFREAKAGKKMPTVIIRCERTKKVWHATVKGKGGKTHEVTQMVLTDVTFVNKTGLETETQQEYIGCGAYHTREVDVYSGFAEGQFVPTKTFAVPAGARQLRYDREEGVFRDACSGKIIEKVAYLVMLRNCHHAYIPIPETKKGK